MKRIFEKEKVTEKIETVSKVQEIKNSFELLMNPEKRAREAREERDRLKKRVEKRGKKEQKQRHETIENRVDCIRDRLEQQRTENIESEGGRRQ